MISDVLFDTRANIYESGNAAEHLQRMLPSLNHYLTNEVFAETYGPDNPERENIDHLIAFTKEWLELPDEKRSVYDLDLIFTAMAHIQRALDNPFPDKVAE